MNKALVLALFLGASIAAEDKGWFMPSSGAFEEVINNDLVALGYKFQADAGYGSHYTSTHASDSTDEVYGVHLYSFGSAFLYVRLTRFWQWTADAYFEPLYWEVFNQHVTTSRFEDNGDITLTLSGDRTGRALFLGVTGYENMQTFERSLVDFLQDDADSELVPDSDDVDFDDDYEVEYADPHWTKSFEPSSLTDLLTADYYEASIL